MSDLVNTEYGVMSAQLDSAPLSDLCVEKGGVQTGPFGSQLHRKDYVQFGTPIITVEHLGDNRILHDNTPFVSDADRERLSKYSLTSGDIVFSRVGSVDRRALVRVEEDGWLFSGRCLRIRVDRERIDPIYLSYFFGHEGFKNYIRSIAVGATMPSINTKILGDVPIYFPKLEEQQWIGEVLLLLDEKIEYSLQINKTLKQIANAIFKSWFVDFEPVKAKQHIRALGGNDVQTELVAQAVIAGTVNLDIITTATDLSVLDQQLTQALSEKLAHQTDPQRKQLATTASHFPDQFVESELGLIPEGWEVSKIGDICDVIDCLHSKKPKETVDVQGNLYLQLNNIGDDGLLHLEKVFLISDEDYAKWTSRIEVTSGDCVITNVGRVGAVAIVPEDIKAAIGRNMTAIRLQSDNPYPAFLIGLLKSTFMGREIKYHTDVGTILDALNVKSIPKLRFFNPGVALLDQYELVAAPILNGRQSRLRESSSLSNTRDALLPKLLSGEVPVVAASSNG